MWAFFLKKMKTSSKWILSTFVLAVLLVFMLWNLGGPSQPKEGPPTETMESVVRTNDVHPSAETSAEITKGTQSGLVSITHTQTVAIEDSTQAIFQALERKNVPVHFWGKIVDQGGIPISGVKIKAHVRTWTADTVGLTAFQEVNGVSDVEGNFEFSGLNGDILHIDVLEKEGYEPEPDAFRSFGYNTSEQFRSNPNSPVLFRMWQASIKEKLIIGEKRFTLIPDGRSYTIDLIKGTIAESQDVEGDLKISVTRPKDAVFGQRYDWSCDVDVLDGGLKEETDNYSSMFLAPSEGYTQTFHFERKADESGWGDSTGTRRFYLRFKNGKVYCRASIQISAYYNNQVPGRVRIEYAINPSGSRVLR